MTFNAVVLTYLEWMRLVGRGWLRLHNTRVVCIDSWDGKLAKVNFDTLMESAPDVGLSATDYAIAEIKFEAWTPISVEDLQLGRMLKLNQVQRFSCFTDSARQVMNATYSGPSKFAVQIFEKPDLWTSWLERISSTLAENRAERFLAHLDISLYSDKFSKEINAVFAKLPNTYHNSKGTRAFGWVTALTIPKKNLIFSEKPTQANEIVALSVKKLEADFHVENPFFDKQSEGIAEEILSDNQYENICNALLVCAAYIHYIYLIQRSNFKEFCYDAFYQDVEWLKKQHINLAAQLVDKIARQMTDELLSQVLLQNSKIPAKNPASLEVNALTAGTCSSAATNEAPHNAPNPEDAGEKEASPALPSPSPVSSVSSGSEKSLAHLLADSTGGYQPNKPEVAGITADILQDQGITTTNAGAASASPEEQIEPNAETEKASGTAHQSATTGLAPGTEATGQLFPFSDEDSSQVPVTRGGGTSEAALNKFGEDFDLAFKQNVLKSIRDQGGSKQAFKQICKKERLTQKIVKYWIKELDPELLKILGEPAT